MTNARYFATTPAVSHLRLAVSSFLLAGALVACAKPNDLPHLQDEALAITKSYQVRFDELGERAQQIRPEQLTNPEVQRVYQQAAAVIARFRNDLHQIPVRVQAGVKTNEPEELQKLIDELRERLEGGFIEANAELDAVDSQIAAIAPGAHGTQAHTAPAPGEQPATDATGAPIR